MFTANSKAIDALSLKGAHQGLLGACRMRLEKGSSEQAQRLPPAENNSGSQDTRVARLRSQPETDLSVGFPHRSQVLNIGQVRLTFNICLAQPKAAGSGLGCGERWKIMYRTASTRSGRQLASL